LSSQAADGRRRLAEKLGLGGGQSDDDVTSFDVGDDALLDKCRLRPSSLISAAGGRVGETEPDGLSDEGVDSMAFFNKAGARGGASYGSSSTAGLQGSLYFISMFAVLVEHCDLPDSKPKRAGVWHLRELLSPFLALAFFYTASGLADAKTSRFEMEKEAAGATVLRRPLWGRIQTLVGVFVAMVILDSFKRFAFGSFEAVLRVCFGGCGNAGGVFGFLKIPNLTRTKHFVLSLIWVKTVGFSAEAWLGRRFVLTKLPLICFVVRILCFSVLVGQKLILAHKWASKLGSLYPQDLIEPLVYFAWPWLMPSGAVTLLCHSSNQDEITSRSASMVFDFDLGAPPQPRRPDADGHACYSRLRVGDLEETEENGTKEIASPPKWRLSANTARACTAAVLALHVGTVVLISRKLQTSRPPLQPEERPLALDVFAMTGACVANAKCLPAAHFSKVLPVFSAKVALPRALMNYVARLAVLLFKEVFIIALLTSWAYRAPTSDGFFARLGAKSVFAFAMHPFFVPLAKSGIKALVNRHANIDALAFLPAVLLWQVFVSRLPLTPAEVEAKWAAARNRASRRDFLLSVLLHPQTAIALVCIAAFVARLLQGAGFKLHRPMEEME